MTIKTNYSGPYKIIDIERDCVCPFYLEDAPTPPHLHLVVTDLDGTHKYHLGYFEESTLKSLEKTYCGKKKLLDYDTITVLESTAQVQISLF